MTLSREPARPLRSREIARILSGTLGGLAAWCSPDELMAAIDHLHANRAYYLEAWRSWERMQRGCACGSGFCANPSAANCKARRP